MHSDLNPQTRRIKTKTLWILAVIGLIVFFFSNFISSIGNEESLEQLEQSAKVISQEEAMEAAHLFAEGTLGFTGYLEEEPLVTYESHSDVYGYLTKEKLMTDYWKQYDKQFPTEFLEVHYKDPLSHLSALQIDVHMTTGAVVAFKEVPKTSGSMADVLNNLPAAEPSSPPELSADQKLELAKPYLQALGYSENIPYSAEDTLEGLSLQLSDYKIGEAQARIDIYFDGDHVSGIKSYFSVPQSHTDYVKQQTILANWLTYAGYFLFTFVLAILAIVYSALTRMHTSFKRGILLASLYFIISMGSVINMMPYLMKDESDPFVMVFIYIVQGIVTLFMSASVYFSLVGGDGLWRQKGINLWARAKEPGYGRHVLTAMADGYAWAFILLGVQAVIFLILENTIQTWSTTDASQSPYNTLYPILLPLMAWMAGIGEEAVYRLFGISMLKKMFRNTVVASAITSIIWALGHTLYPIYPVYSRPIELLIIGLLFSFIFLRHGFIAAVFAHVIFDSILMSLSIMLMGGTLNTIAGVFYIVLPAIVAYIIYLFNPSGKERPGTPPTKKEEPFITTPHPEGHL